MSAVRLTRRSSLLLPFLLAACVPEAKVYPPPRYDFLKPIDLAVKTIEVQIRFAAAGVPPDISQQSPVDPVATLRQMGEDRLKALGSQARAVFTISDASLIRRDDLIRGSMDATVAIVADDGQRLAYAQARVTRSHTGRVGDLQQLLFDMVSDMMDDMNVELEFQIRGKLPQWLAGEVTAVPAPVEQAPLDAPPRR